MRISLQRTLHALASILALLVASPQSSSATQAPKGIYAFVLLDQNLINTANSAASSSLSADMALFNYFSWLLSNDAVSGLLIGVPWNILNPNDPNPTTGSPPSVMESTFTCPPTPSTTDNLAAAYVWNYLDAAFCAVIAANKTLQLGVSAGFNSPQWLYQSLTVCPPGLHCVGPISGHLSPCDSLFFSNFSNFGRLALNLATQSCGYTTIFVRTESEPHIHLPLPLPWSAEYQTQWQTFVTALNNHIKSNSTLVSIGIAGPTASSGEMILPNNNGQAPYTQLTLPPSSIPSGVSTAGGITATAAWNCLLANYYGPTSTYLNSNQAFIDAWSTAIDMYGGIFKGITLIVNTGNGLPIFHNPAPYPKNLPPGCALTGIYLPAVSSAPPTLPPDCVTPANMDCAAETAILSYFLTPGIGGSNAKAIAEDGLSASDGVASTFRNLSAASVKWLSSSAASSYLAPKTVVLGGLQFAQPFSSSVAFEGCQYGECNGCPTATACACQGCTSTTVVSASACTGSTPCNLQGLCSTGSTATLACSSPPAKTCPTGTACAQQGWCKSSTGSSCTSIAPEDALYYVLQNYFAGTSASAAVGAPTTTKNTTVSVSGAPLNYLQIYASDVLYAAGLAPSSMYPGLTGGCTIDHLMSTAPPTLPSKCTVAAPLPTSKINGMTAQQMLNQASTEILSIAVTPP